MCYTRIAKNNRRINTIKYSNKLHAKSSYDYTIRCVCITYVAKLAYKCIKILICTYTQISLFSNY